MPTDTPTLTAADYADVDSSEHGLLSHAYEFLDSAHANLRELLDTYTDETQWRVIAHLDEGEAALLRERAAQVFNAAATAHEALATVAKLIRAAAESDEDTHHD